MLSNAPNYPCSSFLHSPYNGKFALRGEVTLYAGVAGQSGLPRHFCFRQHGMMHQIGIAMVKPSLTPGILQLSLVGQKSLIELSHIYQCFYPQLISLHVYFMSLSALFYSPSFKFLFCCFLLDSRRTLATSKHPS